MRTRLKLSVFALWAGKCPTVPWKRKPVTLDGCIICTTVGYVRGGS